MIKASGYPNLSKIEKLSQFQKQQADRKFSEYKNSLIAAEQFHHFLVDWLTDHVLSTDLQMVPYFNEHIAEVQQSIADMAFPSG